MYKKYEILADSRESSLYLYKFPARFEPLRCLFLRCGHFWVSHSLCAQPRPRYVSSPLWQQDVALQSPFSPFPPFPPFPPSSPFSSLSTSIPYRYGYTEAISTTLQHSLINWSCTPINTTLIRCISVSPPSALLPIKVRKKRTTERLQPWRLKHPG